MLKNLIKPDPFIIMSYGGFANKTHFKLNARVLEDEGLNTDEDRSIWQNASNFLKRLESDEKEDAHVRLSWNNEVVNVKTDEEGYIHYVGTHNITFKTDNEASFQIKLELLINSKVVHHTVAEINKPADGARYMVISDMDDTVIHTGVSSFLKWELLVNTIFKESEDRIPLDGAKEFYQALRKPDHNEEPSSFFYISNSPWNIHDYLTKFLNKYEFPKGTLILRDIEVKLFEKEDFKKSNKYQRVVELLEFYPDQKTILIGDAAEIDTDIYISIAKSYPEQIEAIYIRSVDNEKNIKRVKGIIESNTDINTILIEDSKEAMEDAAERGYIELS